MEASADDYLWTRLTHHVGTTAAWTPEEDPEIEVDESPAASGKCSPDGIVLATGSRWFCSLFSVCAGAGVRPREVEDTPRMPLLSMMVSSGGLVQVEEASGI